ncbi:MAG: hypothetical protein IPL21_12230 [Saprospirales bacterium]|nr:hypothetical protein [Saprospirales bacterium]
MAQVIDKQIIDFLPLLGKEEKKTILGFIKSVVKIKEQPKRISIKQYNIEIDEAMARIDAGEYITQEEVEKESKHW